MARLDEKLAVLVTANTHDTAVLLAKTDENLRRSHRLVMAERRTKDQVGEALARSRRLIAQAIERTRHAA